MVSIRVLSLISVVLLSPGISSAAETLEDRLAASAVPQAEFPLEELHARITSYAVSDGDPFLLAYFVDDGSNLLKPPLYVVRYSRATRELRRATLESKASIDCIGSVLRIAERGDHVLIETHLGPSAGCILVLSRALAFRGAEGGSALGLLGSDWAIVQRSEIHFRPVEPLHISVLDLRSLRSVSVYPPASDPFRREYSSRLRRYLSEPWCRENNAGCDPAEFNVSPVGEIAVNASAPAFAFEARFDASGFGETAEQQAGTLRVIYVYRLKGGAWEHREFSPAEMVSRFGVRTPAELVQSRLEAVFR
jgi:hypothetical protein